jgi:hypothetical protein
VLGCDRLALTVILLFTYYNSTVCYVGLPQWFSPRGEKEEISQPLHARQLKVHGRLTFTRLELLHVVHGENALHPSCSLCSCVSLHVRVNNTVLPSLFSRASYSYHHCFLIRPSAAELTHEQEARILEDQSTASGRASESEQKKTTSTAIGPPVIGAGRRQPNHILATN